MPPWVDETESHTMGAFLLIRAGEEIENLAEVCAAGVVANAVLRPVDMIAKASANAGIYFIIINENQCPSWSGSVLCSVALLVQIMWYMAWSKPVAH